MVFWALLFFVFVADFPGARPESLKAYLKRRWEIDVVFHHFLSILGSRGTPKLLKSIPGTTLAPFVDQRVPMAPPSSFFDAFWLPLGVLFGACGAPFSGLEALWSLPESTFTPLLALAL